MIQITFSLKFVRGTDRRAPTFFKVKWSCSLFAKGNYRK